MSLEGFLSPSHPLSPRAAFKKLSASTRALADYEPETLWELDTLSLPRPVRAYRRKVKRFADRVLRPHALTGDLDSHAPCVNEILREAGREGYLSDLLPAPLGGMSPLLVPYPFTLLQAIKMEEFCAVCGGFGLLLGANGLGIVPIVFSGELKAVARFLVPAFRRSQAGEPHVFAFAITEPTGGSDVEDTCGALTYKPFATAKRTRGGWLLNGRKCFISGGDIAESITFFAALEGEGLESWTCFLVKRGMPGFSVPRTENKMGQRASGAAELLLENVFVPDDHVIGGLRMGWAINRAVLNGSRVPVGAIATGIARGALEHAMSFVCTNRLAGKRLIDYQDVQMMVAQMIIDVSAMRSQAWRSATWNPKQGQASITKVFCSDTAVRVCETAMELMGNQGVLHGNFAEKAFRDARLTQIYEGTNQINRLAIIEDQMEELLALGEERNA